MINDLKPGARSGGYHGLVRTQEESTLPTAKFVVVTNAYPDENALYRNNFVHTRVQAYRAAGHEVEVFAVGPNATAKHYVFEGVDVRIGNVEDYTTYLRTTDIRKLLVHFAHPYMFDPIVAVSPQTPVIVWVHGFETEEWHRRWFNLVDNPTEIRATLARRETYHRPQLEFMRWLFTTTDLDVTIVQVSQWFKEHVSEADVGARARKSVVIPNVIDTDRFGYRPKDPALRNKILAIRPYASHKYANDLSVRAIALLSKRPFFDELEFTMYGDGPLRERTIAPVQDLGNVHFHQRFLKQSDIPGIHADHGVFLVPTRFDSQGVSMCEAMSSGLVPVSTDIAAIGEYITDGGTGLLGAPESPEDIAEAIERLHRDPALFARLSEAAAESIRTQCGPAVTTDKELELMES